ncbi:MAG: hypothetical protein D6722_00510 [Bacteroidetes bacterium]|nr:MAG: hypothetical protein D6722_00510 [Bacteroidota bacterium]
MYVNLSQNESLTRLHFEATPPDLRILELYDSKVETLALPAGLDELYKLDVARNGLKTLSFAGGCPKLWFLDASDNALAELALPGSFAELRYLYLRKNQLKTLTFAQAARSLDMLDLRENQLEALPDNLVFSDKLEALHLHGNPLSTLPQEIFSDDERGNSVARVMDYLREAEKGTEVNSRAKLILVGNGRVGKTSLFRRLKNQDFNPEEPYTHGVQLGQLDKAHLPQVSTDRLSLSVWDFGGQEIFYATHQFFLSEDALYVLAWTDKDNVQPRVGLDEKLVPLDEKWRSEEYWLENIRLHGKKSPILMVQTHSDRKKVDVDGSFRKEPYSASCLSFSAAKDYGLPELKDHIAEKLSKISFFGEDFPSTYARAIEAIQLEREEEGKKSLSKEEFNKLADRSGITKGGEASLLDYLNKTGVVVYLGDRDIPLLKDIIYIDPNWLTQQVYCLINNKLRDRNGEITQDYLKQAFPKDSETQRQQMLELLVNFELIFEDKEEKGLYISPQYLPEKPSRDAKRLIKAFLDEWTSGFTFRFPRFVPDNVMINFLSRYGPYSNKVYWKRGIFFQSSSGVKCLVTYQDQSLTVQTTTHPQASSMQREICAAFVELSRNANAEVSLDGDVFVAWDELTKQHKIGSPKVEAVDGSSHFITGYMHLLSQEGLRQKSRWRPKSSQRKPPPPTGWACRNSSSMGR